MAEYFGPGYTGIVRLNGERLLVSSGNNTAFNELTVAQLTPTAGWKFANGAIAGLVSVVTAGSGSSSVSGGKLQLKTTAATDSSASVTTDNVVRYTPGIGVVVRFTAVFSEGVAGSTQIIGIGDATDGLFFGYNGADFGVLRRRAGVDTWEIMADWNGYKPDGDGGRFTFDSSKGNIFQIKFQWLGYGQIDFAIESPQTGNMETVHRIKYANTSADTSILNPTLPVYAMASNTTNDTAITLETPSAMAFIEGNDVDVIAHPLSLYRPFFGSQASLSTEYPVLSIRSASTLGGITSRIRSAINLATFAGDGNKPVTFRLYTGGTVLASSYTDYSAGNSTLSYDVAGTALSSASLRDIVFVGANSAARVDLRMTGLEIGPGELVTITAETSVAQTVTVAVNILEKF